LAAVADGADRGLGGALEVRRAHNAAIVERIVTARIQTEHVLRCIVQGCHCPPALGGRCQFCGETRGVPVVLGGDQAHV